MPQYVEIALAGLVLAALLALFLPAPRSPRSGLACAVLLVLGATLWGAGLLLPLFDVWYPALLVLTLGLTAWFAMFWAAGERRGRRGGRHRGRDDGDGGTKVPREPIRPRPSSPHGLDWEAFDRQRASWEREPVLGQDLGVR
jgi:hypothetical protein